MSGLLWGNPLAWLGIAAIAIPILVHLLATLRAREINFPTLRFLPETAPTSVRHHVLDDPWLLALRCLIVAVAVAALGQPWLALDGRGGGEGLRAIVVDGSASMQRLSPAAGADGAPAAAPAGGTAESAARIVADQLAAAATTSTVVNAEDLGAGMATARAWIAENGGAAELVVVSDFQKGSVSAAQVEALPASLGLRFVRVEVDPASLIDMPQLLLGDRRWNTSVRVDGDLMEAAWTSLPDDGLMAEVESVSLDADIDAAQGAAVAAASVVPISSGAPAYSVGVVWPGAPDGAVLQRDIAAPDQPWMADIAAALPPGSVASMGVRDGRLLLFAEADPGTVAAATLFAALRRVAGVSTLELAELEPELIDDEILTAWQRPASGTAAPAGSDGRWLWLLVLGLLFFEQWARNRQAGASNVA